MKDMKLPIQFGSNELFTLLNSEGKAELSLSSFMQNAVRLVETSHDGFEWHCVAILHMNRILREVKDVSREVHELKASLGAQGSAAVASGALKEVIRGAAGVSELVLPPAPLGLEALTNEVCTVGPPREEGAKVARAPPKEGRWEACPRSPVQTTGQEGRWEACPGPSLQITGEE